MRAVPRIAEDIQNLIRRERITVGGRLPTEQALADRFGVSRPLVREAIQVLRALGVVETGPRVGLRVLPFDPTTLLRQMVPRVRSDDERAELYEFRCLIEPAMLELVARRARPDELAELAALLSEPLPPGRRAVTAALRRDVAFHEGLWRLARNRFLWGLRELLLRYFADVERREGSLSEATARRTNAQHLAIVRALQQGDVAAAQRAMRENLKTFEPRSRKGKPRRRVS